MKNEKFCFSKGTGLIALVGVLLVGFVLFTQAANQPTSSNTKAAGECTYSYDGVKYNIANGQCLKDVITQWSTSFQCNGGVVTKQEACNPVAPATGCTYKYNGATFSLAIDDCLKDAPAVDVNGKSITPPSNSYKCVAISAGSQKGYMTKQASCDPLAGVTKPDCTYKYNTATFEMSVGDCLKDEAAVDVNGKSITPPSNSYKCVSKGYVAKDASCNPVTPATGCTYKYNNGTFTLAIDQCLKSVTGKDASNNDVKPPLNSNKCIAKSAGAADGYVAKHASCAPTCKEIGDAGFKCGTVAFGAQNAGNTATCKCSDDSATDETPAMWGN